MSSGFKQMLLLKILPKQDIIAKSEAKPRSTFGGRHFSADG
jgi:hypothetical protein